jgi:hypothetical protein
VDDVEVQKAPAASRTHHRGRHLERIAEVRAGTRAEKVPYPIRIREAQVRGTRMIGSGLLRVMLLPAIARWLEELPRTAPGWAFIEVADPSQEIGLSAPEGVEVRWLHRGEVPPGCSDLLGQALRSVAVPPGERVYVWLAGEAGALKPLRRWVRDDLGVPRDDVDVTGYWKRGVADFDEEHEEPSRTSRSRSA